MSWQVVALILGLAALIVVDKLGCAIVNQRELDKRARRAAQAHAAADRVAERIADKR